MLLYHLKVCIFEPPHDKTNKMACAPTEDSDQRPPSLIRVIAVRMKKAWVLSYPLSAQWSLWSDWADAQADLSLRWAHSHFVGFVMRWLFYFLREKCSYVIWKFIFFCFVDIAGTSVEQSEARYNDLVERSKHDRYQQVFDAEFITADCSRVRTWPQNVYVSLSQQHLQKDIYCKFPKKVDTRKIAVINLKFEQCSFAIE